MLMYTSIGNLKEDCLALRMSIRASERHTINRSVKYLQSGRLALYQKDYTK